MPRSPLDQLTTRVVDYFRKHAAKYGLQAETVAARYILNWGGFVNASFEISDGALRYHLKLTDDEETQEQLARWKIFAPRLSAHYHAPRMVDWVKIPRSDYAGLLFEFIDGSAADLAHQPEVLRGALDLLSRLHADPVLRANLAALDGEPETCADYFISVYIDRFDEDLLAVIADGLMPFVPLALFDWMVSETRHLEGLARDLDAFRRPAASPTHGDLWQNNILVSAAGDWHVIDWDDLTLGDPALDYSILLGPLLLAGALGAPALDALLPAGPDLRARFDLCIRAHLLDQVIDPLADWVEAEYAPEHVDDVRREKEKTHRAALAQYRAMFVEKI